jgi:hypothetical protein
LPKGTAEVLRGRETQDDFEERFRETDGAMVQRVIERARAAEALR